MAPNTPSIHRANLLVLDDGRTKSEHIMGVSVSATKADITTAAAIVTANSTNNRPTNPPANNKGANTETSTAVVAITAKATWFVPR